MSAKTDSTTRQQGRGRRSVLLSLLLFGTTLFCSAGSLPSGPKPATAAPYLDLMVTYAVYAKADLWHDAEVGGYWGEVGVGEKNTNGAVRGMCNTMLGYAILSHAWEADWLSAAQREKLTAAGLDRSGLIRYIRKNLDHIIAHHKSAEQPRKPDWGDHWQSSLWLSAAGYSAMLVWDELSPEQIEGLKRVTRHEADRIAASPVHTYKPGNTGAEENAWDTLAPALALALEPAHPSADKWWQALRAYAVNTYSVPADQNSTATLGGQPVREIVTTRNAFDDFTLDNHGFFHPDYVQVSGQHLGEAWQLLLLGDRRNGTDYAERFIPYSLHHVKDVWDNVMSKLVLRDGEFVFPGGNDWTYHCSMNPSYLAFIATVLQDPLAQLAEQRAVHSALKRRRVSPPGRILGDTNLDWWWEPLLIKRSSTALLHHILRPSPEVTSDTEKLLDQGEWSAYFPDSNVWLSRNGNSFVSVSSGKRRMGVMVPFSDKPLEQPYMTLPLDDGILPDSITRLTESSDTVAVLEMRDGRRCAVVRLPNSVVWLSPVPLRPIGIENHALTGGKREIASTTGTVSVVALEPRPEFHAGGSWLNVDSRFGHIAAGDGFRYEPAGELNRRSAAIDRLQPAGAYGAWQMVPSATNAETAKLAEIFSSSFEKGRMEVTLRDGPNGSRYRVTADLGSEAEIPAGGVAPLRRASGRGDILNLSTTAVDAPAYPIENMVDGSAASFAVLATASGGAPTTEPLVLELDLAEGDGKSRELVITPREHRGPKEVELSAFTDGDWKPAGRAVMSDEAAVIRLGEATRYRLSILGSRERKQLNVQIAELNVRAVGAGEEPQTGEAAEAPAGPGPVESVQVTLLD